MKLLDRLPIPDRPHLVCVGPEAVQVHRNQIIVWVSIGGRVAGGNASDSTEIYQEGLRIPPLKLYAAGRPNQAVFDIISRNVRVPDDLLGDLRAQLAAIHIGERGLEELTATWGRTGLFEALEELLAYTERLARAEIGRWPDGSYRFVETKNLNAFLMWVERSAGRAQADRCQELAFALECLERGGRGSRG